MSSRAQFPLFQSHIDLAHSHWQRIVKPGDRVIDATCGNGKDTLVLAQLALTADRGSLFALDNQKSAIAKTEETVREHLPSSKRAHIQIMQRCHSTFPEEIAPSSVALIVYNLGYLPGGNKEKTTVTSTTLESVKQALALLRPGGLLSLTCYPGHTEGEKEEKALTAFFRTLPPQEWSVCHQQWLNRTRSPSLLLIQKHLTLSREALSCVRG